RSRRRHHYRCRRRKQMCFRQMTKAIAIQQGQDETGEGQEMSPRQNVIVMGLASLALITWADIGETVAQVQPASVSSAAAAPKVEVLVVVRDRTSKVLIDASLYS